jgi:hypothetical protein
VIAFVDYSAATSLRRLLSVRAMLFVVLTLAIVLVELIAGFELPLGPIAAIIGVLAVTTLLGWLRLRMA